VEGIHNMIEGIERLRAFYNLVGRVNPDYAIHKNLKKIHRLLKAAGKVSDLHKQQQITRKWMTESKLELSEFYNYLKQNELEERKRFSKTCKKFEFDYFNSLWMKTAKALKNISADYLQFKTEERLEEVIDGLLALNKKQKFSINDYNKIRIQTREAQDVLEIFKKSLPSKNNLSSLNNSLQEMHQTLDKWHEDDMGTRLLHDFLNNGSRHSFYSPSSYTAFQGNLEKGKKTSLSVFRKKWKVFLALIDGTEVLNRSA
jgi:hypothetical protein